MEFVAPLHFFPWLADLLLHERSVYGHLILRKRSHIVVKKHTSPRKLNDLF